MSTSIDIQDEEDYSNKVSISIRSEGNIEEVDAKTIFEAANTIIGAMDKYMNRED